MLPPAQPPVVKVPLAELCSPVKIAVIFPPEHKNAGELTIVKTTQIIIIKRGANIACPISSFHHFFDCSPNLGKTEPITDIGERIKRKTIFTNLTISIIETA